MNTEKGSDTPRTDAKQEHVNNAFNDQVCTVPAPDPYFVPVGFARQLERELSLSQEETAEVIKFSRQVELELRDWQRLQLWGGTPAVVEAFIKGQQNRIHTCQDLELELAEWKACAERLAKAIETGNAHGYGLRIGDDALAEFGRLKLKSSP